MFVLHIFNQQTDFLGWTNRLIELDKQTHWAGQTDSLSWTSRLIELDKQTHWAGQTDSLSWTNRLIELDKQTHWTGQTDSLSRSHRLIELDKQTYWAGWAALSQPETIFQTSATVLAMVYIDIASFTQALKCLYWKSYVLGSTLAPYIDLFKKMSHRKPPQMLLSSNAISSS